MTRHLSSTAARVFAGALGALAPAARAVAANPWWKPPSHGLHRCADIVDSAHPWTWYYKNQPRKQAAVYVVNWWGKRGSCGVAERISKRWLGGAGGVIHGPHPGLRDGKSISQVDGNDHFLPFALTFFRFDRGGRHPLHFQWQFDANFRLTLP